MTINDRKYRKTLMEVKTLLKLVFTGLSLIYFGKSFAQDTLENILARMKPKDFIQIHYTETRYIGMLSSTWRGSGYLYSSAPDTFLKNQKEPEEEIMAVEGMQLYYFKPANKSHHQMRIDENDNLTSSLAALKAMMTGDLSYLRKLYDLQFTSSDGGWRLHLIAKQPESNNNAVQVTLQGSGEQAVNQMEVLLPDGDRSVYVFDPMEIGLVSTKNKVKELLGKLKAE
jgi:hypothetical protein